MAIRFKARVLLELGAELISSDPIALYELVKNSLDATASRVEVRVTVVLGRTEYLRVRSLLSQRQDRPIKNGSTAKPTFDEVRELLVGAFEESATEELRHAFLEEMAKEAEGDWTGRLDVVYTQSNSIQVLDNGSGMSFEDLSSVYLTIGTPNRLLEKRRTSSEGGPATTVLGEKGIGRLSAMRLGDLLAVRSTQSGSTNWSELNIDWSILNRNPDLDIEDFPVEPEVGGRKSDRSIRGTSITIRGLSSDWDHAKLVGLVQTDFAKLVDPFRVDGPRPDIRLWFNDERVVTPAFQLSKLTFAHAVCKASLSYRPADSDGDGVLDGGGEVELEPVLAGTVEYKLYGRSKRFELRGAHLYSALAVKPGRKKVKANARLLLSANVRQGVMDLGSFEMEAYWYNRQRLRNDKTSDLPELLSWLASWGGGLLLYRDGFRVYPYAEVRDDWLDLDGLALGSSGYKMNRKQLVGAVRISTANNPFLQDQTNREGLRDSDEKSALIHLLRHTLLTEFKTFLDSCEADITESAVKEFPRLEKRFDEAQRDAVEKAKHLRTRVAKEDVAVVNGLIDRMQDIALAWERAKLTVKNYENEMDQYVYLAGVGLMTEFVFHELGRISTNALKTLGEYKGTGPERAQMRTLREQLKSLDKRIRILDPLATPGRQRKEPVDLVSVLEEIVEAHRAQFERHGVKAEITFRGVREPLSINAVKGQLIQIFENFIANSVYWLKQEMMLREFEPKISIVVDVRNWQVEVTDNGPGISVERGEEVFDAFVSTKPPGEGRGLGLFIARKLADYNGLKIELLEPGSDRRHHGFTVGCGDAK